MSERSSRALEYGNTAISKIKNLLSTQVEVLEKSANVIFESLNARDPMSTSVWHIFGAGHSHMAAEEAFHRAGGLIPISAWLEDYLMPHGGPSRNGPLERLSGIAQVIFNFYNPLPGEVLTIFSNSGINSTSVELAEIAKSHGVSTVAITNLDHSKQTPTRHSGGKKLYEVCDYVIDTGGVRGDAAMIIPGLDAPVGPLSTIINCIVVNYLTVRICELYSENMLVAPVYMSANVPGGDERNRKLEQQFRPRIPRLL